MTLCGQRIGDIFGQVNEDRTGTAFGRDEIGLGNHPG